ncbi:MAG: DUF1579 family protein [Deltaproteobacteria bacterium]|nr:DUF1579 family protein [Deltaproteobacteria bacterium]
MEMPQITEQHRMLNELFSGTWRGEERLHPSPWDPEGGPAFATWIVRPSLDGFFLLVDYDEERGGKIVYRGHGVHGWDAGEKCYLVYWFDNAGVAPKAPSRATLEGGVYRYINESPNGRSRFTYRFQGDHLAFTIETSSDGKSWAAMHEGRYTRQRA